MSWRRDGAIVVAVVAVVFASQLPFRALNASLLDEGAVLQIADIVARGGVPYVDGVHYAFPAVFYVLAALFSLAGTSMEVARLYTCALFAGVTGVAYLIVRWFYGRAIAPAVTVAFLAYRVWAYPHWQLVNYSPLAIAMLLLATWILGEGLRSGRSGALVCAGAASGLAVLAKQDSGAAGTAALGLAVVLLCRPGLRAALAFGSGWTAIVGAAVLALFLAGAGPAFVRQAIVIPIRTALTADYPARPPLWPPWRQSAHLRDNPFSYMPPVVLEQNWPTFVASRLYRETALPDLAVRTIFVLPWLAALGGLAVVVRRLVAARPLTLETQRLAVLMLLTFGSIAAFNKPQDWAHLLVLYPPTMLLLFAVVAPLARHRALVAAASVTLGLAFSTSAVLAVGLGRRLDTAVHSPRGVVWTTAPQARALQPLLDRLVDAAPPDAPLLVLPYHPLVAFLSGRRPLTRFVFLWPADPAAERDGEIRSRLAARPDALVVYSTTQAPFLPSFATFTPELLRDVTDRYVVDAVYGGSHDDFGFFFLTRRPPPVGVSLLDRSATVTIDGAGHSSGDLVSETVWPFLRVLRVATRDDDVTIAYRLAIEPGMRFEAYYGINPDHWLSIPPPWARFAVAIRDDSGEREVWSAQMRPMVKADDRRWPLVTVDLSPWAGHTVDLLLRVRGAPARPDLAGWGEPRLIGVSSGGS